MSKDDSILFGAKRAGITWLFEFEGAARLKRARAGAARLGMSLAELLCRHYSGMTGAPALPPNPRTFKEEDRKASVLKIQIIDCDNFTRRCLERQAKNNHCESVEEYILDAVFTFLPTDEDTAIYDPQTGDAVLFDLHLGDLEGYTPDKGVPPRQSDWPKAVNRIPAGTIVEQCA